MNAILYVIGGGVGAGLLLTLAYLWLSRSRAKTPELSKLESPSTGGSLQGSEKEPVSVAQDPVSVEQNPVSAEREPAKVRELPNLDLSGGTTKIDRQALRSIVKPENSGAEEAFFLVIAGEGVGRLIRLEREDYIIGRDPVEADICFLDDTISKQHARIVRTNGRIEIQDLGSSNGTFVDGEEVQRSELKDGARIVLGTSTVLTLTFQDEFGERFQQQMYESSTRDALTGALKKAAFYDQARSEMHFAQRHGTNFCVIILDIDHFKPINDTHGHVVGDEILGELGDVIRSEIRSEAIFVRYGGEEFIIAERGANREDGAQIAERVRARVEAHRFNTSAGSLSITLSLGVADLESISEHEIISLISKADSALYSAKEQGRNRVVIA